MNKKTTKDNLIEVAQAYMKMLQERNKKQYTIVLLGGSIEDKNVTSIGQLRGVAIKNDTKLFDDRKEAQNVAKRRNRILSPGDKKYYGLKYVVAEVINGKYTGN